MKRDRPWATVAKLRLLSAAIGVVVAIMLTEGPGWAQSQPAQAPPAGQTSSDKPGAPGASLSEWAHSITANAQLDAGIAVNPQTPNDGINFGQLITDKANRPILNQLQLTLERDIDPNATGYDVGFKLQSLYGSDERIFHTLGVLDHAIHDRLQFGFTEANVTLHTPWAFSGGIDFKGGIFSSPLGFEVINPANNPFYTYSYIANILPFEHLGLLSTAHVSSLLDLYLGIDGGVDTTLAEGDNNRRPAGITGFGLNLLSGNLTVLALTHIGPENSKRNTTFADSALRYYNDLIVTWKATPALALTTEAIFVREEGFKAEVYGASEFIAYTLNKQVTLNGRAEILRDNNNFFVSTPVNNLDYVNGERGYSPANFYTATGPTTYSELTAGITWRPTGLPAPVTDLRLRPELRYDRSLSGTKPFDDGRNKGQWQISTDVILGF